VGIPFFASTSFASTSFSLFTALNSNIFLAIACEEIAWPPRPLALEAATRLALGTDWEAVGMCNQGGLIFNRAPALCNLVCATRAKGAGGGGGARAEAHPRCA
jgi:hypothetical protein